MTFMGVNLPALSQSAEDHRDRLTLVAVILVLLVSIVVMSVTPEKAEFPKPVTARRLLLSQALQRRADLARVGLITAIDFGWNKSKRFERFEMNPNPMAPTEFRFPKARKLRKFTLRIVGRSGKAGLPVGFAEVVIGDSAHRSGTVAVPFDVEGGTAAATIQLRSDDGAGVALDLAPLADAVRIRRASG